MFSKYSNIVLFFTESYLFYFFRRGSEIRKILFHEIQGVELFWYSIEFMNFEGGNITLIHFSVIVP